MHRRLTPTPEYDKEQLEKAGYTVIEKSPYHWHVKKPGQKLLVNVWPTTCKLMPDGAKGSLGYFDVVKSVNGIFKSKGDSADIEEAKIEVDLLREQGLEYFKNKKK